MDNKRKEEGGREAEGGIRRADDFYGMVAAGAAKLLLDFQESTRPDWGSRPLLLAASRRRLRCITGWRGCGPNKPGRSGVDYSRECPTYFGCSRFGVPLLSVFFFFFLARTIFSLPHPPRSSRCQRFRAGEHASQTLILVCSRFTLHLGQSEIGAFCKPDFALLLKAWTRCWQPALTPARKTDTRIS